MGLAPSKYTAYEDYKKPFKEKKKELLKKINGIAGKILIETSSEEILKFLEPKYCNSIIQIVERILNVNFTENKIKAIHSLIKNHKTLEQNILDLNKIEIGREELTKPKKTFCYEIALYYVKFSHLYSAIYHVINPILNKKYVSIENMSFCGRRDMRDNIKEDISTDKSNVNITVSNHFCDINKKTKKNEKGEIENTYLKKLGEETGIKELDDLYKDEYDPVKKKFVMSSESKKEYTNALSKIYKSFTGKDLPDDIESFKDIPLYSYEKNKMCKTKELDFKTGYVGSLSPGENDLIKYIKHIKRIMQITYENNEKFIQILDEMFKKTENGDVIINDEFTMDILDEKIKEVRKFIVSMYIDCEKNFRKGITLFKKIVLNSKLKKIIKMESVKEEKVGLSRNSKLYNTEFEKLRNNKESSVKKYTSNFDREKEQYVKNIEELYVIDNIVNDNPELLQILGNVILHDFYLTIKEKKASYENNTGPPPLPTYNNFCFNLIAELLYILLYCDINYLIDKNNIYYSLFINIFNSNFMSYVKNPIEGTKLKDEFKFDEYSGIHFNKCCDGKCRNKDNCEDCELFKCFIKGERWSYFMENGDSIDLCGECYKNYDELKTIDEFKNLEKTVFEKKEVAESFNEPGCEDLIDINLPENLINDGKEFRRNWNEEKKNKNWKKIKDISNFRVIKDITLLGGKIKRGEGVDIIMDNRGKYEIIDLVDDGENIKINMKIKNDEKDTNVTGILDDNVIIFPMITPDENRFLNQFILS